MHLDNNRLQAGRRGKLTSMSNGSQCAGIMLRLPHFHLVGNELFFLISRRPHARLSVVEADVWKALESNSVIEDLRARFGVEADRAISRFVELGVCAIGRANYGEGRRRVLVFEPHSDDAVLSVGGTMWLRQDECEFTVVTVGSQSNFTSYYELDRDYFNVDQISRLRNAEGALFARLVGGRHRALNQPEATLRYRTGNWTLEWYRRNKLSIAAFTAHHSTIAELRDWTQAIRTVLRENPAEEIWFPLGSTHTDHQLTRDAFLTLMLEEPALFEGRDVRCYQDVPYAARFPTFTPTVLDALSRAGAVLVTETVPIARAFDSKLRLISLFASQFKLAAIRSDVERSARLASADGGLAERFWKVEKFPQILEPPFVRADGIGILGASERLAPWLDRHRNAERIRLLLLVPAGRWADDMNFLLDFFSDTRFAAYVACSAEVEQFISPRIEVHEVGGGKKAWLLLALRLMLMRPMPTIFLAGERRLQEARWLSVLWPASDALVMATMDHFVSALRQLTFPSTLSSRHENGSHHDRSNRPISETTS
jgi:LmbE family N-acetylglucosaminyl deacetylase